jgi:hypothetical protein
MELKVVGSLQDHGSIRAESIIYGIDPSHGFFKLNGRTHFIPEGRNVATYLPSCDGREQFRSDDQMVFNRPVWFATSNIRRVVDVEEPTRVITNLIDDTQCWEILPGKSLVMCVGSRLRVPNGARFVVLASDGTFRRWVKDYKDWEMGF